MLSLLGLSLLGWAAAVGTPAGTTITNQVSGTADPVTPGAAPLTLESNLVSVVVSPVCSLSLLPDGSVAAPGQSASVLPGEQASFAYMLRNTGNSAQQFGLELRREAGSAHTPLARLVLDRNANGVADPGESDVSSVSLAADSSAALVLVASALEGSAGDAYLNVVASCPGGSQTDSNNVSRLRVLSSPELSAEKSFSPALVAPGERSTVTLTARNGGQGDSRAVTLSDDLGGLAPGLSYVPGSAVLTPALGTTEYDDGSGVWRSSEPATVRGIRVVQDRLAPGAAVTLRFQMLASAAAENRRVTNTAVLSSQGRSTEASSTLSVQYSPGVALGPVGQPLAPEGSAADSQTRPLAIVGQPLCFEQTLLNTGNVADRYTLAGTLASGAATLSYFGAQGEPLSFPLQLPAGASVSVRVCLTPVGTAPAAPLDLTLTVSGERGTSNTTRDLVTTVQGSLPGLIKRVTPQQVAQVGDTLTYTLELNNPYAQPLTGLTVTDLLSSSLSFVSADQGGVLQGNPASGGAVRWTPGSLAPGASLTLTLTAKVAGAVTDGAVILNTFSLSSAEVPNAISSNTVSTPVWSAALKVIKEVDKATVNYGDLLTYLLTIRNLSPATPLTNGVVTDVLPAGLVYVAGTSTLGGQPLPDPSVSDDGRTLTWGVGELSPGLDVRLGYQTRVTPQATGDLINSVTVKGMGGRLTAIASNMAVARTKLVPLNFAAVSDLIGQVYIDRNRDGRYQAGSDAPVARARVVLAGGRLALTDAEGRYHFAAVPSGTQVLRLDLASVANPPLDLPQDADRPGTRVLALRSGLTSADFPLAPLAGDIDALRSTRLSAGPLTVQKMVRRDGPDYVVRLTLTTTQLLASFVLNDPLPSGARLLSGRPALETDLNVGETTLTYRFAWTGEPRAVTTDPRVSWRY